MSSWVHTSSTETTAVAINPALRMNSFSHVLGASVQTIEFPSEASLVINKQAITIVGEIKSYSKQLKRLLYNLISHIEAEEESAESTTHKQRLFKLKVRLLSIQAVEATTMDFIKKTSMDQLEYATIIGYALQDFIDHSKMDIGGSISLAQMINQIGTSLDQLLELNLS